MIRIGILDPTGPVGWSGYFQYMVSLSDSLAQQEDLAVTVFHDDPEAGRIPRAPGGAEHVLLRRDGAGIGEILRSLATVANVRSPWLGRFGVLRRHGLDGLVSPASLIGFHLDLPFIGIVFDVMYRYYPDCAEYPLKERLVRELINSRLVRHAACTVVDSEKSRGDLVRFYGADAARVTAIPLCPPPSAYDHRDLNGAALEGVAKKYRLPPRFVFYPAQPWEHKNHRRLLEALALLRREHGLEVPAVFVGSNGPKAEGLNDAVNELGLCGLVRNLGYVGEEEIVAIYKKATALVFPSFADYTNLPVLEAMLLGAAVVCSNAFAMPEQVGDAGLLFDPFDVRDIAAQIRRVWTDDDLRQALVARGRERAEASSLANFGKRWGGVVRAALAARHA